MGLQMANTVELSIDENSLRENTVPSPGRLILQSLHLMDDVERHEVTKMITGR
jgi:hypothetical protein